VVRRAAHGAGFTAAGIFIAQLLAFTPIAFLVLIGCAGISPSLEEAAQTLRRKLDHVSDDIAAADAARVSANAFLLGSSKAWPISETRLSSAEFRCAVDQDLFCRRRRRA